MSEMQQAVLGLFTGERILALVRAALILGIGLVIARIASGAVVRVVQRYADAQQNMVLRRAVYYVIAALAAFSALNELGFQLGVLLGAAGILTVAIGFASQTSASNVISGLFLLGERPFVVGDVIKIGNTTGEVLSVDLLSVKLRTFDNLYVRIPNETVVKSELANLSHFPIRRLDLELKLSGDEEVADVRGLLREIAEAEPHCLAEPTPAFTLLGLAEASMHVQFSVWVRREHYPEVKNALYQSIKRAFDAKGIRLL